MSSIAQAATALALAAGVILMNASCYEVLKYAERHSAA